VSTHSRASIWDDAVVGKRTPSSRLWTLRMISDQQVFILSTPQRFTTYNGLDILMVYSWAYEKMKSANDDRFALHYIDLRRPNFFVDQHQDLQGYPPTTSCTLLIKVSLIGMAFRQSPSSSLESLWRTFSFRSWNSKAANASPKWIRLRRICFWKDTFHLKTPEGM
jgi:hypothetical protein